MTKGNMNSSRNRHSAAAMVLVALALAGCGSTGGQQESRLGNFLVAPGRYQLYDCQQLAQQAAGYLAREKQLREVKAKAEASPGGALISPIAYGMDYGQVQGILAELRREVREKKCNPPPPGLMTSG